MFDLCLIFYCILFVSKRPEKRDLNGNYLGRAVFIDFIGKIKQVENNKKPQIRR